MGQQQHPVAQEHINEEQHWVEERHLVKKGYPVQSNIQDIWNSEIWKNLKPQSFTSFDISDFVSEYPYTTGLYQ